MTVQADYRIVETPLGFEPQIKWLVRGEERWFALQLNGYWADPDEWNEDASSTRMIVSTRSKAEQAVLRARSINRDNARSEIKPPPGVSFRLHDTYGRLSAVLFALSQMKE